MLVKCIIEAKGPEVITVLPGEKVRKAAKMFRRKGIGFALVESGEGALMGTLSERDIVQAFAELGDLAHVAVSDLMTPNIVTCDIDDTLEDVREIMTEKRTRHVLVMENGKLHGVVSIGDLIKHSLDECRIDATHMMEYISGKGYN